MTKEDIELLKTNIELSKNSSTVKAQQKQFVDMLYNLSDMNTMMFNTFEKNIGNLKVVAEKYEEIVKRDDLKPLIDLIVKKEDVPEMIRKVTRNYENWEILVPMMAGVESTDSDYYLTDRTHKYLKNLDIHDIKSIYEQIYKVVTHSFGLEEKIQQKLTRARAKQIEARDAKDAKLTKTKTKGKTI